MKYILSILLAIIMISCVQETNPIHSKGVVLSQVYTPAKIEYIYHYSRGKGYHWSSKDISATYNTKLLFLGDTVTWNDSILYNKTKPGDTIEILYVNRFTMSREDTTNIGIKIKQIITHDTNKLL